ncbi:2-C-methyl-D-erythritol 4-phosphate cytidylyltransferase [Buchnera aphidicola]|uniref:2-C-methyl-D-erythritol 4-phosphate cytidylyltransferase n=1 Tax=Buchnera aphidicola (Aphis gossypii) TaxID=98785 RepID=A0A5J6ZA27_9GAMM|nr:2-C-methyl-D-erythritol 4-phosphate cytidylyltransferase [Buchnera aphidicola]QFQ32234.1 2-C-methyl-D-erythritol 4-phosphate cytidylyltransferase [Buchnera aphidicola (Aphis gossypii)]UPT14760.1 2-C-methyl-D-erythritol 4-phosphate cytidylyltransferase [Buchnera aphidicola (Aphis gossypii)]
MILKNTFKPKILAIVPAAGIGKRMLLDIPKQYIKIKNRTILEYTLTTLLSHPSISHIIVSLNKKDNYFHELSIASNIRVTSVIGGNKRINSVLSGLIVPTNAHWVIVHDAVRPCLSHKDLEKLISIIKKNKIGGILARPVFDSIKYVHERKKISHTIARKKLWHALTPQLFPVDLLRFCLKKSIRDNIDITDESSALEYCGYHPSIVLGSYKNIKITFPEDLVFAEIYLKKLFNI